MARRVCWLGAAQRVHSMNIIIFLHFSCICGISYLARQSSSSTLPGPSLWTHLQCQQRNAAPSAMACKTLSGEETLDVGSFHSNRGPRWSLSESWGGRGKPSCPGIRGLRLGTHCRQLYREPERKRGKCQPACPPCVYGGRHVHQQIPDAPGRGPDVPGLTAISGRVRVQIVLWLLGFWLQPEAVLRCTQDNKKHRRGEGRGGGKASRKRWYLN